MDIASIGLKSHPRKPHPKSSIQQDTALRENKQQLIFQVSFLLPFSCFIGKSELNREPQRSPLKGVLGEWLSAGLGADTASPPIYFSQIFRAWALHNTICNTVLPTSIGLTWCVLRLPVWRQPPQIRHHSGFSLPFTVSPGAEREVGRSRCEHGQSQLCPSSCMAACTAHKLPCQTAKHMCVNHSGTPKWQDPLCL